MDQGRIVLRWLPGAFSINVVVMTDQMINCRVEPQGQLAPFMCTFVYGSNDKKERCALQT